MSTATPESSLLDSIFKNVNMDNAGEFNRTLLQIESELNRYKERFKNSFVYCLGCKEFVKLSFGYEDTLDSISRPVLRCHNCHTIIKFLDQR